MQHSIVWIIAIAALAVVAAAVGVWFAFLRGWVERRKSDAAGRSKAQEPLLSADDRSRDAWVGRDGARRPVAMRCAFPPGTSGAHAAAWGCLDERGMLAIVSPAGRDEGRRAAAQGLGALELARSLRPASNATTIAHAFEQADKGISGLREWNGSASATAVAVSLEARRVKTLHVGADRVYRVGRGDVDRLTEDHSVAEGYRKERGQSLRDSAPEIDAMPLHFKSAVTRVLGSGLGRPDVVEHELSDDQWLVVVSQDVVLGLGEVRLREILGSVPARPHELAEQLVVSAYPSRPGGFVAAAVFGAAQA